MGGRGFRGSVHIYKWHRSAFFFPFMHIFVVDCQEVGSSYRKMLTAQVKR